MRLRALAFTPALLLLAACGGESEPADNSSQVCTDFASAQLEMVDGLTSDGWGDSKAQWYDRIEALGAEIDTIGLTATNADVKSRIGAVAESVPDDVMDLRLSRSAATGFNNASEDAGRACAVVGTEVQVDELPVNPLMRP